MNTATTQLIRISWLGLLLIALAIIITLGQVTAVVGILLLPVMLLYLFYLFRYPVIGIYACLVSGFFATGLTRYIDAPLGVSIDLFLVLTLVAAFFERFDSKQWTELKNPILVCVSIWVIYCVFELFNPEVVSYEAWIYAVRSPAFYMLFTIVVGLLYMKDLKEVNRLLHIWLALSVLAALYSFKQFFIGLDEAEKQWLAANASTHLLYGNLRVFSFYSDAAQFGAAMAHAALAAIILALGKHTMARKLIYLLCGLVCLYAMALTGTRGALFVLFTGALTYLFLSKNFKVLFVGICLLAGLFFLLKFTYVGQSNYQVQRMRSAFNLKDPSFQVRIKNQVKLSEYLESRPFGGGIGSAGYWGMRFSPDTFLAKTPVDSWYVKIWVETGIVGIILYLAVTLFILGYLGLKLWRQKDHEHRQPLLALFAGMAGIFVANYGNQLLGQMPTNILFYLSIAVIYTITTSDELSQKSNFPVQK